MESQKRVPAWLQQEIEQRIKRQRVEEEQQEVQEEQKVEDESVEEPKMVAEIVLEEKEEEEDEEEKEVYVSSVYSATLLGCRSVHECFERIGTISEGSYGVVHKAKDKMSGKIVALKKIKLQGDFGFPITSLREINLLMSIRHPNVMGLYEIVVGRRSDQIYMVMEYSPHELKSLMTAKNEPFTPSEVKCLMKQLLQGVAELHRHWIIHRDLKTSNLLLSSRGTLKICDLGLARKFGSPLQPYTPLVVTLWYRAPELLLGAPTYSSAIDMWSVGCIFAEMLTKKPLFEGAQGELAQLTKIFELLSTPSERSWPGFAQLPFVQKWSFRAQPHNRLGELFPRHTYAAGSAYLTENGFQLLSRMLTYDPARRITAEEALQHPWFDEPPLAQDARLISLTKRQT